MINTAITTQECITQYIQCLLINIKKRYPSFSRDWMTLFAPEISKDLKRNSVTFLKLSIEYLCMRMYCFDYMYFHKYSSIFIEILSKTCLNILEIFQIFFILKQYFIFCQMYTIWWYQNIYENFLKNMK